MSINWFPGHMHKAIKEIKEILPKVDVIIEVLDARIPYSSANPVIEQFRGSKPGLKILAKSDLADPVITEQWLTHFRQQPDMQAIAVTTQEPEQMRKLVGVCKQLLGGRTDKLGNVTALITGIPNVGKSTLINTLAGRSIARTGNEPAITQSQQRIDLANGLVLIDSPGILWPKIHNAASGYRLALSGAIKNTAMDEAEVVFFGVAYFLQHYPEALKKRFQLEELPSHEQEFLELAGRQRGCLGPGGRVDLNKISAVILNEFRAAILGNISLETPDMAIAEKAVVDQLLAEKAAAEAEDKKRRKAAFKQRQKS